MFDPKLTKFPDYKVKYSKRKSISIEVKDNNEVVVRAPRGVPETKVIEFVRNSEKWIRNKVEEREAQKIMRNKYSFSEQEIERYKYSAKELILKRVNSRAKEYRIKYKKVRVSNAKKRWGSCSTRGTISINWRLVLTPKEVLEYVITHELMHLKHMNHSKRYWQEVEKAVPKYKEYKKWLRDNAYLLKIG
jgi:predicted metal-dependent hydrolase